MGESGAHVWEVKPRSDRYVVFILGLGTVRIVIQHPRMTFGSVLPGTMPQAEGARNPIQSSNPDQDHTLLTNSKVDSTIWHMVQG